ncbi:hypothetical protein TIFTF001_039722 [Ficus carica]|uniref:Retrotransposon gag domain-containing protein n=1 Tax=Ficus carica TaxID=3494 RepID=A0AA88CIW0_FICCA|nr:hypothetical protein TIFTF001_039719 [Ficus carica]GMN19105.1 hypothetical protein TIFTF001_039722 [Ficus carica]
MSVAKEHYNEFNNFRQENLSVTEAVKRFNQLARLCPHMMPNEEERLKRMIGMLRLEIAVIVDSGTAPPTTTAKCVKCTLRAEYHLNKKKESQPRQSEVPKNNNNNQNRGNFGNQGKSQGGQWNNNKRKGNFSNQRNLNNRQGGDAMVTCPRIVRINIPALPAKTAEKPTGSTLQYAYHS